LCLLACGLALASCSKPGQKVEDFTPPPDKARKALEAALDHWQSGHPPGTVAGTSNPTVDVVDSRWQGGQRLKSYEILGEEAGTEPRFFKVRLTPTKGPPQEVRYAVFGIDPLQVYREEDFQKLSGTGK
jgi:hypothetical protein